MIWLIKIDFACEILHYKNKKDKKIKKAQTV